MNITGNISEEKVSDEVINLDQTYFPTPWTTKQWQDLNLENHTLFGWRVGGKLTGIALLATIPGDDTAHLLKILLLHNSRGTGASLSFWAAIIQELRRKGMKSVYLEVETTNQRAEAFYKKVGFKLLRVQKGFYSGGEDALIMNLTL